MVLLLLLMGELTTRLDQDLFQHPNSLPPPTATRLPDLNLQLHKSSTRLTALHAAALSQSCTPFCKPPSRTHTPRHTLSFWFTLSPGSAPRQRHHHHSGGDSSDGKIEGVFLCSARGSHQPLPTLSCSSPSLSLLCLSSAWVRTTQMF